MKNIEEYTLQDMQNEFASILTYAKKKQQLNLVLSSLLSENEIKEIFTRWQLICSLIAGEPQREIANHLHISLGKIARGSKLLKEGNPEFYLIAQKIRTRSIRIQKRKKSTQM